ncbi:MAG: hypothetical protein BGO11_08435 [Solirubrobacterales bacterium 70-9]|nr:MAG: hypothetical protein BGO11_08435 [Solirubrobacterales bacterium 70-9]
MVGISRGRRGFGCGWNRRQRRGVEMTLKLRLRLVETAVLRVDRAPAISDAAGQNFNLGGSVGCLLESRFDCLGLLFERAALARDLVERAIGFVNLAFE